MSSLLLSQLVQAVVLTIVGVGLLAAGYAAMNVAVPGRLINHLYRDRSINAAVVGAAAVVGLGGIIVAVMRTASTFSFGRTLIWSVALGVVGVALQVLAFRTLDRVLPGGLTAVLSDRDGFHPAAIVAAATMLVLSLVVIASLP